MLFMWIAAIMAVVAGSSTAGPAAGKAVASSARGWLICVSNERSGDVTIIDGASRRVLATLPVGKRPRGLHASADGKLLYVALSGSPIAGPPTARGAQAPAQAAPPPADRSADGIGVIDLARRKLVRTIEVGVDPEEFALDRAGKTLVVSNEDAGTASFVSLANGTVQTAPVGPEPEGVTFTPDGRYVFVASEAGGSVTMLDARTGRRMGTILTGGRPRSIAFSPDGARAFLPSETTGELHAVDVKSGRVTGTLALPAGSRPMGLAMSRDGATLFVSNGRGGTVSVVDPKAMKLLATIPVGQRPWGIGLSPDGATLFAADGPGNDIAVIDVKARRVVGRLPAGAGPWGIAVVPVGASAPPLAVR